MIEDHRKSHGTVSNAGMSQSTNSIPDRGRTLVKTNAGEQLALDDEEERLAFDFVWPRPQPGEDCCYVVLR